MPMTWTQYRTAQDRISRKALLAALLLLRKVEANDTAQARRLVGQALLPVVLQARDASRTLALTYYADERARHVTGQSTPVSAPHYELAGLERELRRTLAGPNPAADAAASVVRHVEQAGRETITTQAKADPKAKAWARRATGRETCSFCLVLVSRGPVYQNADFRAHNNCDCVAVPVFDVDNWPGRDEYLAALKSWDDATKGKSGDDALNAFRRVHRKPEPKRGDKAA